MKERVNIDELIQILKLPTQKLYKGLKKSPYAIAGRNYVLWYRGEGLPCLVAHIDHVYEEKGWGNRPILCNGEYIWSPRGIAGDDRCGVYALMLLFDRLNVNALFTNGEERGGIGAKEACEERRLADTPYFIEIDRRGVGEVVFYNHEEEVPEFSNIIAKHFQVECGSFSDISILGKHFNVCSANLSAGYFNQHQESAEYIHVPSLEYTIKKVPILIEELGDKRYKLPESPLWSYSYWSRGHSKNKRAYSSLWHYEELIKDECPTECWDCGALEFDALIGYWCWEIDGAPDSEHPQCLKKKLKEVKPWV